MTGDVVTGDTEPEKAKTEAARTRRPRSAEAAEVTRELLRSKTFLIGMAIVLFWAVVATAWPVLVPHDPQALDPTATLQVPSPAHWMGTDNLGRDVFARVLAGATSVLTVAPIATLLGLLGGVTIGLVTGYYRGVVDGTLMRLVDAMLAFPVVVLAALVLAVLGSSTVNVIVVVGIVFTPLIARTARSAVLIERDKEYVHAARLRGDSGARIMVAEILPNITGPLVVEATVRFGYAVFTSATLSFLSLGLRPPSPDWGLTISLGRSYLEVAPWMVLYPALALGTLVVAINLVADAVRPVIEQ